MQRLWRKHGEKVIFDQHEMQTVNERYYAMRVAPEALGLQVSDLFIRAWESMISAAALRLANGLWRWLLWTSIW